MPHARSDGADLYWKLEGEEGSPPLILLNSIGTDMDLWDAALPALRRRFRLLRIDTRGHGASSAPPGDYRLATLARDVVAVMAAAGIATASIAGVSLGGMIAMQLAVDAPERIRALAVVCSSATMDRFVWADRVSRVRADGMESVADVVMSRFLSDRFCDDHPETAATIRCGLLTMAVSGYAGCAAAIRDMTLGERLGEIACPTLVVTGTRDRSTPLDGHGEHLLAGIGDVRHVEQETAHLAPIEAPDELASLLIGFFEPRRGAASFDPGAGSAARVTS